MVISMDQLRKISFRAKGDNIEQNDSIESLTIIKGSRL